MTSLNQHVDGLVQQGRIAEAIAQLNEAARRIPNNAQAHCRMASLLASQGKREEAKSHFTEALRIQPGYKEAEEGLRGLQ
jgi:Flp pilus assembly protein TadD